jgi:hypothetical protein
MNCLHQKQVKNIRTINIKDTFYRLSTWKCTKCLAQTKKSIKG